ncbi:hypothetical protein QJ857_gp1132 [Tupanvirus soda lake]|uniref:Amine oxidase domain-containing protein n=2 Tax=Tupanvirus TaxID=2094720 RepID=A0A6N1NXL5_9VIRU|nr:hypothetical protein QJ857_gp1132 [Tupanvirus soda lake]QKU34922.1 hypothetical protein [Tupanvirus soda lake]
MNLNVRILRALYGRGPTFMERESFYQKSILFGKKQISGVLSSKKINYNKKIVIVGAGLSGLMCGWILNNMGFKVKILESRSRPGGRVHTINNNNKIYEAGAEHIGLNHPLLLYFFSFFNLPLEVSNSTNTEYLPNIFGNKISLNGYDVDISELPIIEEHINKILNKISNDAQKLNNPAEPWNEPSFLRNLDKVSLKDKFDEWNFHGKARIILEKQFEFDNLANIGTQSYLGILCQIKGDGYINPKYYWDIVESLKCVNGNQSLAEYLAYKLDIEYNSPVQSVRYNNDSVCVVTSKSYYFADNVVITVPPSVWADITFYPTIDISKIKPALGPAVKILFNNNNKIATKKEKNLFTRFDNMAIFVGGECASKELAMNYVKDISENDINSTNMMIIDWPNEKYTNTGYSYPQIGKCTTIYKELYYPIVNYHDRLIFGGEHTQLNYAGFMEGALQSGLRIAKTIIASSKI